MPGNPQSHREATKRYRDAYSRYPHIGPRPSKKTVNRDIQRLMESYAGTETAQKRRQRRLANAKMRGGAPPSDTTSPRGAEKTRANITVGHFGVRSFLKGLGLSEAELTREGTTGAQTGRSNFGTSGQGNKTIMQWRTELAKQQRGTYSDRTTELEPVKERTKDRTKITTSSGKTSVFSGPKRKIGPAPRIGMAAGFRGALPSQIIMSLIEPLTIAGIAAVRDDITMREGWEYLKRRYSFNQNQEGPMV
jgi:hypothetical protein